MTNKISKYMYSSVVGNLEFQTENDESLISLKPCNEEIFQNKETEFSRRIKQELDEYFSGERKTFDIKINPEGTDFQKRVWAELLKIPYGQTRSYGQIAQKLGGLNYSRAIGSACNRNHIMIIIPCHRVISSNGTFGGFEFGITLKKYLLRLEKRNVKP